MEAARVQKKKQPGKGIIIALKIKHISAAGGRMFIPKSRGSLASLIAVQTIERNRGKISRKEK